MMCLVYSMSPRHDFFQSCGSITCYFGAQTVGDSNGADTVKNKKILYIQDMSSCKLIVI